MAEYIEREAVTAEFKRLALGENSLIERIFADGVYAVLETFPAANVAPVVQGRWVHDHYEDCTEQFEIVKCSNCGYTAYAMALFVKSGNFCPNCGARMEG